jgi:hypothetical protein
MPIIRKIAPPEHDEPEDLPPDFPPLTRGAIRDWLGEATLQCGAPYVEDGIFDTRRSGRTLRAARRSPTAPDCSRHPLPTA